MCDLVQFGNYSDGHLPPSEYLRTTVVDVSSVFLCVVESCLSPEVSAGM